MLEQRIGFSTGALAKGDYRTAIEWLKRHHVRHVELSALRFDELEPLVKGLEAFDPKAFRYISFHAPSSFQQGKEEAVIALLKVVAARGWNIVVHPDVVYTPARWRHFGHQLLIENMDRRKASGRTASELARLFTALPNARLCLDVAHARQMDTTLALLWDFTRTFQTRIAEVHISELDSHCRHLPLSWQSIKDYQRFAHVLRHIPVIIESMLFNGDANRRHDEIRWARVAMDENGD